MVNYKIMKPFTKSYIIIADSKTNDWKRDAITFLENHMFAGKSKEIEIKISITWR